jgi:hypothetical protein
MADSPNKAYLRKAPRFAVTPKSDVFFGGKIYKALVQDLSDSGMLLICNREFAVGDILGVHLNLAPGVAVDCEVEVRHSSELGTGAKIDFMDDLNRKNYQSYLQEFFSHQLNKSG